MKSPFQHKITKAETIKLSGVISSDGTKIELDGEEKDLTPYIEMFAERFVDITITEKTEETLIDEEA